MNKLLYNLLADSKHFLQALHASIGLDFNRNMYVFDIAEKFTINQILKHAAKSGYLVTYRRDYLRNTAANIRAEKEKNNYISIDNTEKITALQAQIMQKKAEIIAILSAATTAAELSAINKKLSYFRGLEGIARDFENLRNNDAEKKYSSIDAFNNRYNDILSQLSAI